MEGLLRSDSTTSQLAARRPIRPGGRRRRFLRRTAFYAGVAAVVFVFVELYVRHEITSHFQWYGEIEDLTGGKKLDALFIGTSRVPAAVDATEFDRILRDRLGREHRSLIMAAGGSTLAQHYMGLRNWVGHDADALRGCTVFIEAAAGLPCWDTWDDVWHYTDHEFLSLTLMNRDDLSRYWKSRHGLGEKINVTLRYGARPIHLLTYRAAIREWILDHWTHRMEHALEETNLRPVWAREKTSTARDHGIRQKEREAVLMTDRYARSWIADCLRAEKPVDDWNSTVVARIVAFVHQQGGQVVFFHPPISDLQEAMYTTAIRRDDRREFMKHATAWGTPVIDFAFPSTESDFPDNLHLVRSRATEYTRRLAVAVIESAKSSDDRSVEIVVR